MADLSQMSRDAAVRVSEALPPLIVAGGNDADVMVTLETIVTVGVLFNERVFRVSREVSTERLETLIERVMERLAAATAGA
ncbi:hypothetical protein KL86PLE_110086 [uncultured Pleomorphomonas sp.]|uniref:Uncharacterized protein n=1 Tax=uncultured Pleomorphomonas sp. TaxID=442121 RepID=A0A212L7J9_9HYPH|nr:hypothetical protein [uncultured Pleomorphomonas sp.]SCM73485.1 hypothetical protein KL86PLE_110086 [uncultured Pleomorphomonas sp.]